MRAKPEPIEEENEIDGGKDRQRAKTQIVDRKSDKFAAVFFLLISVQSSTGCKIRQQTTWNGRPKTAWNGATTKRVKYRIRKGKVQ